MNFEKEITGSCPHCGKKAKFREFSLTESVIGLGGFIGEFFTGGITKKAKNASALVNGFSDSRSFPNYKCGSCGGEVMQCSGCKQILPYAHDGSSHVCGAIRHDAEIKTAVSSDDVISKIERLGALKDKGLITEQEFQQQKQKILSE